MAEKSFLELVADYQEKHACHRIDAVLYIARRHPNVHRKHVEKFKAGHLAAQLAGDDFMDLVNQYQQDSECSKTEAMLHIMKANPESHRRYLEEANTQQ